MDKPQSGSIALKERAKQSARTLSGGEQQRLAVARAALKIADLAYVMETGRITLSGTGKELLTDTRIKDTYTGGAK